MSFTQKPPIVVNQPVVDEGVGTTPSNPTAPPAANGSTNSLEITKFQFRQLFTTEERIAIDNAEYNLSLSGRSKAILSTITKDLAASASVGLRLPSVISGVQFLVSVNMITTQRAGRILAGLPPL